MDTVYMFDEVGPRRVMLSRYEDGRFSLLVRNAADVAEVTLSADEIHRMADQIEANK